MKSIFKRKLYRIIYIVYNSGPFYYHFEEEKEESFIIQNSELIDQNKIFHECDLVYVLSLGDTIELNLPTGKKIFTIEKGEFNDVNDDIVYHVKEEEWIKDEITEESKQNAEKELQRLKDEFNTKQQLKIENFKNRKWWEFWKEVE